ncbi:MAG TPA: signal peptidase I [Arthrobacter sp.]
MNTRRPVSVIGRAAAAVLARAYLGIAVSFALCCFAPMLIQWQPTIVLSGSMEPSLKAGDVVVARPVTRDQTVDGTIKPGHVLLAESPTSTGTLFTHRVVARNLDGDFVTRGDANAAPDPAPLPAGAVKGIEVIRVPLAGYPVLQARQGNFLPAAALIILTAAAQLIVRADNRRNPPMGPRLRDLIRRPREATTPLPPGELKGKPAKRAPALTMASLSSVVGFSAALVLAGSAAVFTGTTSNPGNSHKSAAVFPVPGISAKPLRFGVGEPNGSISDLDLVSREVGEYPSYSQVYRDFTAPFNITTIQSALAKGVTPVVTWEPFNASIGGTAQPTYALKTITAGNHDAYLTTVANQLVAAGNPRVYIRFAHEMNGNWYPWGAGVNGNVTGDYANAWRHVVDLFRAQGVTNVTWVWAPNINYPGSADLVALYPGTAYVGLTGLDGFNWGTIPPGTGWKRPWDVFGASLGSLQYVAPDKNILITEVASTETEGANTKALWILDVVYYFNHWGDGKPIRIEGFIWFDFDKEARWRIDSSKASYDAMRRALSDR